MGRETVSLVGQTFGQLEVSAEAGRRGKKRLWLCTCVCSGSTIAATADLRSGHTQSCGCLKRRRTSQANLKHGLSKTRAYQIWHAMWRRCSNPSDVGYERYGGRGIKVCARWRSVEAFVADMGHPPDGLTLDRINADGDYEPTNCRWATAVEQAREHRKLITFEGATHSVREWAEIVGVDSSTLCRRLQKWSVEQALRNRK